MKILAFAGSLRSGSLNRKLLQVAIGAIGGRAEVDLLDLREVSMPIFDGDLEASGGLPEGARRFKQKIAAADALLIASPEYNNSVPGGLKNAIDWASRPPDNPFKGRVALLLGASPGAFGAVRGGLALRQILTTLMAFVIPQTVLIPKADQAFDEGGQLKEPHYRSSMDKAVDELLKITQSLKG